MLERTSVFFLRIAEIPTFKNAYFRRFFEFQNKNLLEQYISYQLDISFNAFIKKILLDTKIIQKNEF